MTGWLGSNRDIQERKTVEETLQARTVERHNGKVWAESPPAKGAALFFTLA